MPAETAASGFREHVVRGVRHLVEAFPAGLRPDIYVVSLRVDHVDQDPRFPYVAVGYNTRHEVRRVLAHECSHEGTAAWEYAYWPLEGFARVGHVPEDRTGSALHLAEARAEGLWYEEDVGGEEDGNEERDDRLVREFDDVCTAAARSLHDDGCLRHVFGRSLPVVLFDMDRPGWEAEATEAVNPPGVLEGSSTVGAFA
ncbi:hypothetical protein ACFWR9_29980 [Streptomyces sp. NPDC058534]|uniref:hypothetical protein n=1 Tax=Streptomyces sp. NPDC058534 TaxID=3346541 RepID=UPI003663465E